MVCVVVSGSPGLGRPVWGEAKKSAAAQHYLLKRGASCVSPGAPPPTHTFSSIRHTGRDAEEG